MSWIQNPAVPREGEEPGKYKNSLSTNFIPIVVLKEMVV